MQSMGNRYKVGPGNNVEPGKEGAAQGSGWDIKQLHIRAHAAKLSQSDFNSRYVSFQNWKIRPIFDKVLETTLQTTFSSIFVFFNFSPNYTSLGFNRTLTHTCLWPLWPNDIADCWSSSLAPWSCLQWRSRLPRRRMATSYIFSGYPAFSWICCSYSIRDGMIARAIELVSMFLFSTFKYVISHVTYFILCVNYVILYHA